MQPDKSKIFPVAFGKSQIAQHHKRFYLHVENNVVISSWASFPLYDICLAGFNNVPSKIYTPVFDGLAMILPTASGRDYEVIVGLTKENMEYFELGF